MNIILIAEFLKETASEEVINLLNISDRENINVIMKLKKKFPDCPISDLLTLYRIRGNAKRRIDRAEELLFTVKGVEQSSSSEVAKYHGSLFAGYSSVADLCCGNGIDLIHIASNCDNAYGVDLSDEALVCSKYNSAVFNLNNVKLINGKAEEFNLEVDAIFIDPDRRPDERRVINGDDISPSFDLVLEIISQYKNVVVKLSPVFDYKAEDLDDLDYTWEFVSEGRVLKEVLLCTGSLSTPNCRYKSVILPNSIFRENRLEIGISSYQKYIFEPDVAIIRAGLVQDLGASLDYKLLHPRIAILTGEKELFSEFGICYEVLESFHYNKKNLQEYVYRENVGNLIVKVRGFPDTPEKIKKKLKIKGKATRLIIIIRLDKEFLTLVIKRSNSAIKGI